MHFPANAAESDSVEVEPFWLSVWVQVGVARGALECGVGITYLARGIVTFRQAGAGIVLAGLFALAYLIFYPRAQV